jgi:hypothetical protein
MAGRDTTQARIAELLAERRIAAAVERRAGGYTLRSTRTGGPIARLRPTGRDGKVRVLCLVERRALGPLRSAWRPDHDPRQGSRLRHLRAGLLDLHLIRTGAKMAKVELRACPKANPLIGMAF